MIRDMETRVLFWPVVIGELAILAVFELTAQPSLEERLGLAGAYAAAVGAGLGLIYLWHRLYKRTRHQSPDRMDNAFLSDLPLYEDPAATLRQDSLGFDGYAQALANFAIKTEGPFTIGIQGSWGHGKTSLLRVIESRLITPAPTGWRRWVEAGLGLFYPARTDALIVPVRFNAWQYEHETSPLLPLLLSINASLERTARHHLYVSPALNELKKAIKGIVAGTIASTELKADTAAAKVGLSFSPGMWRQTFGMHWQPNRVMTGLITQRSAYYQAFSYLQQICTNLRGNVKIVLFIDDLDRCSPENALRTLEEIKLVLWQPQFIFFLALDSSQLEAYINDHYRKLLGDDRSARNWGQEYFEKLLQVTFRIPQHHKWYDVFVDQLYQSLDWPDDVKRAIKPVLGEPLGYNPRRTISIVNSIILLRSLLPAPLARHIELIAMEVILRVRYGSRLYQLLCGGLADDNEAMRMRLLGWEDLAKNPRRGQPDFADDGEGRLSKEVWQHLSSDSTLVNVLYSGPGKLWLQLSDDERYGVARLIENQEFSSTIGSSDVSPLAKAFAAYQDGEYDEARRYYEEALTEDENNIDAYIGLEKIKKVAADISLNDDDAWPPGYVDARVGKQMEKLWDIAHKSIKDKKYLRAEKALLTILRVDEKNATAYNRLGILYAKQRQYKDAIECFEIAVHLEPSASSHHNLGLIYYETGDYKRAEISLREALALESDIPSRHIAYAKVMEKLGKVKPMIAALERAVELEPSAQTMQVLIDAYGAVDQPEMAAALQKRLTARRPRSKRTTSATAKPKKKPVSSKRRTPRTTSSAKKRTS